MTPPELLAMLRRQLKAVVIIFVVAVAGCYFLIHENPGYADTGQVAFNAPSSWGLSAKFSDGYSLLVIEEITGWFLMSAAAQDSVRADGGTAAYDVALYNAYNEEYPNYSQPYFTVTTRSNSPAAAARTFDVVLKILKQNLRDRQLAAGSPPATLSEEEIISSPSGPVSQDGSHKRTFLGFILLTLIAILTITRFLDRRRAHQAFGMSIRTN